MVDGSDGDSSSGIIVDEQEDRTLILNAAGEVPEHVGAAEEKDGLSMIEFTAVEAPDAVESSGDSTSVGMIFENQFIAEELKSQ